MRIGSLFAGIGGLELGLEWAGVGETVWQVEQDPYCLAVLAKHWPKAQRFTDVREVGVHNLLPVDVICGGFPCQPHSHAGKRRGAEDERFLWPEFARIIRELRPSYVILENVANILADGTALSVLGELAALRFDAEWDTLSACAVGASHTRERVFVVAYTNRIDGPSRVRDVVCSGLRQNESRHDRAMPESRAGAWLDDPSALYRDADGVPNRVDRGRALGNAVVPAVAEVVGRRLMEIHRERCEAVA